MLARLPRPPLDHSPVIVVPYLLALVTNAPTSPATVAATFVTPLNDPLIKLFATLTPWPLNVLMAVDNWLALFNAPVTVFCAVLANAPSPVPLRAPLTVFCNRLDNPADPNSNPVAVAGCSPLEV